MEIKDSKELKWPPILRYPPDTHDKSKYYDFCRDHGHITEDCFALKQEIQALIKREFLDPFVSNDKCPRNNQNRDKGQRVGETSNQLQLLSISLSEEQPREEILVAGVNIKRILVDNGSAANVLSHEAFVQMGISSEHLKPIKATLQGF
ncbi:uncharacterized protein LOC111400604 [Olea europaea var. sylvestris]|uniref:uncharacterized protein LOC111400604 n=1 Tax=Olea europaea var. sylvestris TaxID=158386 RepID=UPI000C1CF62B|nr:uncharacterized protein LOC111400604 [Olea europaea var. sylvestris]